jgi:hypothetical protein
VAATRSDGSSWSVGVVIVVGDLFAPVGVDAVFAGFLDGEAGTVDHRTGNLGGVDRYALNPAKRAAPVGRL